MEARPRIGTTGGKSGRARDCSGNIICVTPPELSCPQCHAKMSAGVVVGRSPGVKFKPSRNLLGDLGGVLLTRGFFNHSVDALRCDECGTVVIPGH